MISCVIDLPIQPVDADTEQIPLDTRERRNIAGRPPSRGFPPRPRDDPIENFLHAAVPRAISQCASSDPLLLRQQLEGLDRGHRLLEDLSGRLIHRGLIVAVSVRELD